jgi:hypothetical protein
MFVGGCTLIALIGGAFALGILLASLCAWRLALFLAAVLLVCLGRAVLRRR